MARSPWHLSAGLESAPVNPHMQSCLESPGSRSLFNLSLALRGGSQAWAAPAGTAPAWEAPGEVRGVLGSLGRAAGGHRGTRVLSAKIIQPRGVCDFLQKWCQRHSNTISTEFHSSACTRTSRHHPSHPHTRGGRQKCHSANNSRITDTRPREHTNLWDEKPLLAQGAGHVAALIVHGVGTGLRDKDEARMNCHV